jgi:hypothetical protein
MRIFIIGTEQSGKSTASRFLSLAMNIPARETGRTVIRHLANLMARKPECLDNVAAVAATIECNKERYRKDLRELGNLMTQLKPTALIDDCADPYTPGIIVGVRRQREVMGLANRDARYYTDAVWIRIDRPSKRDPREVFELQDMPCDYIVKNDGSLNALRDRMRSIARSLLRTSLLAA